MRILLGVALLLAVSSCADIDRYPASPVPLTSPEAITDASLTFDTDSGHAVLTWTAPKTSVYATALTRYEIRYVYDAEFEWENAVSVLDPPAPADPGVVQEYRFENPDPGGVLTAAIVTIDDADRMSEHSNFTGLQVPGFRFALRVTNAVTLQAESGIEVDLTGAAWSTRIATDAEGGIELTDVRPQKITVSITNDAVSPRFFDLVQEIEFTTDLDMQCVLIPHSYLELYPSATILLLVKQATSTEAETNTIYKRWANFPLPLYIPEFVNINGFDYKQAAVDAANRWMELTGVALWEFVDEPASWGVELSYKTTEEMGIHIGLTHHQNDPDGYPLRSDIDVVDTLNDAEKLLIIMLHELGHTIRIKHLPKRFLMYGGQPLPNDPTNDEVLTVRIMYGLLQGTDMSIYREVSP
jgi:hypothetical protein